MATIEDFHKLDIRVGTIVKVEEFPEAKKPAFKVFVDFGLLGVKKSSAQITQLYSPESLVGRQVIAVVNFPPRQVGPFISEVLILGAVADSRGTILLAPERKVENGDKIA
ncbi:tRNA-binding protein [Candidatus Woesearchaeota archaeon]|nr:tRNA-binding protein [Candidatus Woesearchaeota archaeon]